MNLSQYQSIPIMRNMLENIKTIAIVGLSPKDERDSNKVARYLIDNGYEIIPVNPVVKQVLNRTSFKSIEDIPIEFDAIDVFRKSEEVPEIVEAAIRRGVKNLWLQLGVIHEEAAEKASKHGINVIMDKCIKQEHQKLI